MSAVYMTVEILRELLSTVHKRAVAKNALLSLILRNSRRESVAADIAADANTSGDHYKLTRDFKKNFFQHFKNFRRKTILTLSVDMRLQKTKVDL